MNSEAKVVGLMLAAGRACRFGADKRRARLADGRTLLEASLENAAAAFDDLLLVLRDGDRIDDLRLPPRVRMLHTPQAERGLGASLAAGVAALATHPAEALAVLLGDMPWVRPETCARLIAEADAARIVQPCHDGRPGHPVLFGRTFWPALCELDGDEGARGLIRRHADRYRAVQVEDSGILLDVDRTTDLNGRPAPAPSPHRPARS
ncbi:nucleotidyltransferase family protein [Stutzerimonas nosocomialis]|uniref:Nucleotidyltransferase family protein n=1 Tax=Stutzerimonas nosocomialis TaxID=1056496 RepID=A0A5R9QFD7_9GAMM|nr:nucleotidyltransferase family protein [Stutzerimonas nosocomialis]TLX63854.1 nucleotidyltransferase family protein [Stutzerimonas nosocomialis]